MLFVHPGFAQQTTEEQFIEYVQNNPGLAQQIWDKKGGLESNTTCLISHWMDVDNDGDYDLVILGREPKSGEIVKVFLNENGEYKFVQSMKSELFNIPEIKMMAGLGCSSNIVWYDQNNDGYKDFTFFQPQGLYQSGYFNNGDGTYTKMTEFVSAN